MCNASPVVKASIDPTITLKEVLDKYMVEKIAVL